MLYVDEMRYNLGFLQESDKRNGRHFFVLKLNLAMGKKHPIFAFQTPIVFFDVDQIDVLHFVLVFGQCGDGILHEHFSIDLIKDHYSVHLLPK